MINANSTILDTLSQKSTNTQTAQLPPTAQQLHHQIHSLSQLPPSELATSLLRLQIDPHTYETLLRYPHFTQELEILLMVNLVLGVPPQECVANLHHIVTSYQDRIEKGLVDLVVEVMLVSACGGTREDNVNIVIRRRNGKQAKEGKQGEGKRDEDDDSIEKRVMQMEDNQIQASAFIRSVVLSKLFTKVCELASTGNLNNIHGLLLLASIVVRVQLLAQDVLESLLQPLMDIIDDRQLCSNDFQILLRMVTNNKWSTQYLNNPNNPQRLALLFPKLLNLLTIKLIKQRETPHRNAMLLFLLQNFNQKLSSLTDQLLQSLLTSVRKQSCQLLQSRMLSILTQSAKNQVTLRLVKGLIKNLKVYSSKNGQQVYRILKSFELLAIARECNTLTHTVLEFSTKSSWVQVDPASVKVPYTLVMEVQLKGRRGVQEGEFGYVVALLCRRGVVAVMVRKHKEKRHHYDLKVNQEVFDFQAPGDRLCLALATHSSGLHLTANNFSFLIPYKPSDLKTLLIGNALLNDRFTSRCAISQLTMFYLYPQYLESSQLFCKLRTHQLSPAKHRQLQTPTTKAVIFLNWQGNWQNLATGGTFAKLFHVNQQFAQLKDCYKANRQSLLAMLRDSGNLNVFLMLIEYYSLKTKESEFLVLVDAVLTCLLELARVDERGVFRMWLFRAFRKLALVIWVISYTLKEKNELISKILSLVINQTKQPKHPPTAQSYTYQLTHTILLNFQIWRNFHYQDQLAVLSILSKLLSSQPHLAYSLLSTSQLTRLPIAILVYYKMEKIDAVADAWIKRKLTKEQLLRLHFRLREIYVRTMVSQFKYAVESRKRQLVANWVNGVRGLWEIVMVAAGREGEEECSSGYSSKQSLLEMLRVFQRMLEMLSQKETLKVFQEVLNKDDFLKVLDTYTLLLLQQHMAPVFRVKRLTLYTLQLDKVVDLEQKSLTDMLISISIDLLLLKNSTPENIIDAFDKLNGKETQAVEVVMCFRLLQRGQVDEAVYKKICSHAGKRANSESFCLVVKEEIRGYFQGVGERGFMEGMNGMAEALECILREQSQDIISKLFKKYLECQPLQSLPQSVWRLFNSLTQFPQLSATTPPSNPLKISSQMPLQPYMKFIQQSCGALSNSTGISPFSVIFSKKMTSKELKVVVEAREKTKGRVLEEKWFWDLVVMRAMRGLVGVVEGMELEGRDEGKVEVGEREELKMLFGVLQRAFNEQVYRNLRKDILFQEEQEVGELTGLALELQSMYKALTNPDVDNPIQLITTHRELIQKSVRSITKYAQTPVLSTLQQPRQLLTIPPYTSPTLHPKPLTLISPSPTSRLNLQKSRESFLRLQNTSQQHFSQHFEQFESTCQDIEQQWKKKKKLNYYWQYFNFSRENNFYSVDGALDSQNSRVNIKVVSDVAMMQQFPRRKSVMGGGSARFRLSSENNSSISRSDHEGDVMMKSMMVGEKKVRKESQDVVEVELTDLLLCEDIKPKGVYFGQFKVANKQAVFTSSPKFDNQLNSLDEQLRTIIKLSTNDQCKLKKQKKLTLQLPNCTVFTRRYILRHTALQIFHKGKSHFFNFFTKQRRNIALTQLKKQGASCISNRKAEFEKQHFYESWRYGKISNYEYLMKLNLYSGRTYNDLSQYHVFPWVITNFRAERVDRGYLEDRGNFRDLGKPMGELNQARFEEYMSRYKDNEFGDDIETKCLYGSFYSNPTIITHYLIRLQPFSALHWRHQSKRFDHADRLFSSIQQQYKSSTKNSSDLKQLIPQFYSWPEFLRNRNQIDLGIKQNKTEVNDVECPRWASCAEEVVFRFREALESEYVSRHLHKWVDLVFGVKARQEEAIGHNNLFHYRTYEHDIFANTEDDEDEIRTAQTYISEFGQVPQILFDQRHQPKLAFDNAIVDTMCVIANIPDAQGLVRNSNRVFIITKKNLVYFQISSKPGDNTISNFQELDVLTTQRRFEFLGGSHDLKWIDFSKSQIKICSYKYNISPTILTKYSANRLLSRVIDNDSIVSAEQSRIVFYSIKDKILKFEQQSNSHQQVIYAVEYCAISDILVSVDRDNIVGLHYAKRKTKIRSFGILMRQEEVVGKIRVHPLGFIFFWTKHQNLLAYSFMGDLFFKTQLRMGLPDQKVTQFHIFSSDKSLLLFSSDKGVIYSVDIFDIYRFCKASPKSSFLMQGPGLLGAVTTKYRPRNIMDFSVDWDSKPFWKVLVLYENGDLGFFVNQSETNLRVRQQMNMSQLV